MGTDINGWVEIKYTTVESEWFAVINVSALLERNYMMFGSLFGVNNRSTFMPVAPRKGLPSDVSETVKEEAAWDGYYSHTWLTWAEVKAVDWEELTTEIVGYITAEDIKGHDHWHSAVYLAPDDPKRQEGTTWEQNGFQYTAKRVTRWEMLGTECQTLFDWMRLLARKYGDDWVRLVVYFDS